LNLLEALYADIPEDQRILIWTLPDKKSAWFDHSGNAGAYARARAEGPAADVYVGMGLCSASDANDAGAVRRARAINISGIACLWADIDFSNEVKGGKAAMYPPDTAGAHKILAELPQYSAVVHSGHGLQVFWILHEPWIFDNETERASASALSRRWGVGLRGVAESFGWTLDSVHDLTRVMRVPGTFNCKRDERKEVKLLGGPESLVGSPRYAPEDFSEWLDVRGVESATALQSDGVGVVATGSFVIDPGAVPPFVKFTALCAADGLFMQSFHRQRTDLSDQSPSGYDFSLASFAARDGWSDQEIVDLLVAARSQAGEKSKLREDYFVKTLSKVRGSVIETNISEKLEDIEDFTVDEVVRESKKLEVITEMLGGVRVTGIKKFHGDVAAYSMATECGEIMFGSVNDLIDMHRFRAKWAEGVGKIMPKMKGAKWDLLSQLMLDVVQDVEVAEDLLSSGVVKAALEEYLHKTRVAEADEEMDDVVRAKGPFRKGDTVYFFAKSFHRWLRTEYRDYIPGKDLSVLLRAMGYKPRTYPISLKDRKTSVYVWAETLL